MADPKALAIVEAVAVEPEQHRIIRRLIGESHTQAAAEERRRALSLVRPLDAAPISSGDVRAAGEVDRLLKQATAGRATAATSREAAKTATPREALKLKKAANKAASTAMAKEKEAHETRLALDADRTRRADTRWVDAALAETAALETARGEVVERPKGGGLRLKTRDGLKMFFEGGRITEEDYKAGVRWQAVYEACSSSLPSQLGREPGGAQSAEGSNIARKLKAIRERGELEAVVHGAFTHMGHRTALGRDALLLLEQVAGQGYCLRHVAAGSRRRARAAELLGKALRALADHYRLQAGPQRATRP